MELDDEYGDTILDDVEPVVITGTDGDWTWAWEQGGTHGLEDRLLHEVSRGTEAVVLHHNDKPVNWLKHAVDGSTVLGFHDLGGSGLSGSDPQRFAAPMSRLGLLPGQPGEPHAFLTFLEDAFGLRVTPPGDDEQRWTGNLLPL
ncbi:hypothetical protein J3486_10225 [Streptomyces sp. VRA16 Mangrove soil]|nr:hypothetical protein [Streptomyces sp. VRA16 Mangrove soil]